MGFPWERCAGLPAKKNWNRRRMRNINSVVLWPMPLNCTVCCVDILRVQVSKLALEFAPPDKVGKLEHCLGDLCPLLSDLSMAGNALPRIENLGKLTALTSLNLSDNRIGTISGLEKLVNLEKLDLSGNVIERVPNLECGTQFHVFA